MEVACKCRYPDVDAVVAVNRGSQDLQHSEETDAKYLVATIQSIHINDDLIPEPNSLCRR